MVSADKYHILLKYGPVSALAIALSLTGIILWEYGLIGRTCQDNGFWPDTAQGAKAITVKSQDWDNAVKPASQNSQLAKQDTIAAAPVVTRYRLAGTFFALDEAGTNEIRKAILDDSAASNQLIVTESQSIDDIVISRVFKDHIIILRGQQKEELWLTFNLNPSTAKNPILSSQSAETAKNGTNALSRFGEKMIGENRWIFDRKLVLDYYNELRDNPDRLVAVFDSLKPIYGDGNKITGYRVGIEGEAEFFKAVGFKEGDVVRSVNSLPMTNRRRAEYFISEFVKDRANAFVIAVERDGRKDKLIYQVR